MGGTGLEQPDISREKCDSDPVRSNSVATGGGFASCSTDADPLLAEVIAVWPALSDKMKRQIVSLLPSPSLPCESHQV